MSQLMLVNPARRKTTRKKSTRKRASTRRRSTTRRAPARSRARKATGYRRNPIRGKGFLDKVIDRQLKPAAVQASGALAVDVMFGYLGSFLPANLTTGMARHATRGLGAVLLSFLTSNFLKSTTANEMAKGSLTVTLHEAGREFIENNFAAVPLGFYSPAYVDSLGYYPSSSYEPKQLSANAWGDQMGMYVDDNTGYNTAYEESFDSSSY